MITYDVALNLLVITIVPSIYDIPIDFLIISVMRFVFWYVDPKQSHPFDELNNKGQRWASF